MNKKQRKEYDKRYREEHQEEIRESQREYREFFKEEMKEYLHEYNISNKEAISENKRQYYLENKDDILKKRKEYQKNNVKKISTYRKERNKRKYGITQEIFKNMLEAQNNVCAICGNLETSKRNNKIVEFSIDHVHGSNPIIIRGILCSECNIGIGKFKDSPRLLQKAIDYLESFNKKHIHDILFLEVR